MADSEWRAEFCVNKRSLRHLAECLQIPDAFVCNQGSVCEGMEALCIYSSSDYVNKKQYKLLACEQMLPLLLCEKATSYLQISHKFYLAHPTKSSLCSFGRL